MEKNLVRVWKSCHASRGQVYAGLGLKSISIYSISQPVSCPPPEANIFYRHQCWLLLVTVFLQRQPIAASTCSYTEWQLWICLLMTEGDGAESRREGLIEPEAFSPPSPSSSSRWRGPSWDSISCIFPHLQVPRHCVGSTELPTSCSPPPRSQLWSWPWQKEHLDVLTQSSL